MLSTLLRKFLTRSAVVILAFALLGTPSLAYAVSEGDVNQDTITWAVRPSDGSQADGRTSISVELDPGDEVSEFLEVTNLSNVAVEFSISAADGYFTAQGRFNMLPSDKPSLDAGTWIELGQAQVTVAPGGSATIPFVIAVPENATPGDHPAGIAASVLSVAESEGGATMGVESRVGFRVMTRVTGQLTPSIAVSDVRAEYRSSWDILTPGAVEVSYVAENTGNSRLDVTPDVSVSGLANASQSDAVAAVELFPGDARTLSARIERVWPLGFATVAIELAAAAPEGGSATAKQEIVVWTIPWLEFMVIAGIALIAGALLWGRKRNNAKVHRIVADAREQWQREASEENHQKEDGR